jgi:NAD(P)-dependent dehydrogenase (short-subunit alcohol dehydrogenase family)
LERLKETAGARTTSMHEVTLPVCVVVGAGPGNGAALARRFAAAGHPVALIARSAERITELAASLPDAKAFACDAGDPDAVAGTFAAIRRDMGPVGILVYNAGKGVWGDALSVGLEEFESAWRVNAFGALLAVRQVLPEMIAAASGTILFIGATASRRGNTNTAAFAPAKAAQRALAESLARAYGPQGVHVALLVIDAVVDEPYVRSRLRDRPDDFFCKPDEIAETAFMLSRQDRSAWTFELDLRPFGETW